MAASQHQQAPAVALREAPASSGTWISALSHLDPRYGGLSAAVPELGAATARSGGFRVQLAAFCVPGEEFAPTTEVPLEVSYWPASRLAWLRDRGLKARFREQVRHADGLHIHGLWAQSEEVAAAMARELERPYIVSAHGMLEPWALEQKKWKKRIYAALTERRNLGGAACLHALTRAEAEDYRRFGVERPIAVIPNGVRVPDAVTPAAFLEAFPHLWGKQLVLFLGRLHFKKGVLLLVKAWAELQAQFPDAHLVLAGPDCENTRSSLETHVRELALVDRVTFTGMLAGERKWSALAAAHCFVLPSYSEGLSVSLLEAMGLGVPVILTRQCHLPEVASNGAGWEIDPDVSQLVSALKECLRNGERANRSIGNQGRAMVERSFHWSSVGRQMSEVYAWVQGGSLPTSCEIQTPGLRA
ncbi:MAG TPA: glycosyltransferase [Acidobacteriaceae bacterium]